MRQICECISNILLQHPDRAVANTATWNIAADLFETIHCGQPVHLMKGSLTLLVFLCSKNLSVCGLCEMIQVATSRSSLPLESQPHITRNSHISSGTVMEGHDCEADSTAILTLVHALSSAMMQTETSIGCKQSIESCSEAVGERSETISTFLQQRAAVSMGQYRPEYPSR